MAIAIVRSSIARPPFGWVGAAGNLGLLFGPVSQVEEVLQLIGEVRRHKRASVTLVSLAVESNTLPPAPPPDLDQVWGPSEPQLLISDS